MRMYHGTSVSRAKSILNEGFKPGKKNWTVSRKEVYFYREGDMSYGRTPLEQAYWNGLSAALIDDEAQVVVFEVEAESSKYDQSNGFPLKEARVFKRLNKDKIVRIFASPDITDAYDILMNEIASHALSTFEQEVRRNYDKEVFEPKNFPLESITEQEVKKLIAPSFIH